MRNLITIISLIFTLVSCVDETIIPDEKGINIKATVLAIGDVWVSNVNSPLHLTVEGDNIVPFVFRWLGSADCWHLAEFVTENQDAIIEINTDIQLRIVILPTQEENGLILEFILVDENLLTFFNQIYNFDDEIIGESLIKFIPSTIDINTLNYCN